MLTNTNYILLSWFYVQVCFRACRKTSQLLMRHHIQIQIITLILLNTKSSHAWALHNLHNWIESRNSNSDEKVTEDLLSCPDAEVVCKWLCLQVLSVYVSLCMRHKKRMANGLACHNLLSAVCCLPMY